MKVNVINSKEDFKKIYIEEIYSFKKAVMELFNEDPEAIDRHLEKVRITMRSLYQDKASKKDTWDILGDSYNDLTNIFSMIIALRGYYGELWKEDQNNES